MDKKDPDKQDAWRSVPVFGTSLALGSAVLILGGYGVDRWRGGGYAGTIIGLLLALVYVIYETWKLSREITEGGSGDGKGGTTAPRDG